jgi:hypothetical protein
VSSWTLIAALESSSPFSAFSDFFSSGTWRLVVLLGWFLGGALWLACTFWVFKDSRRRIEDKVVIVVAVLTGLVFGPLGALIYAIVRPPEYLSEVRERELEMEVLERRLGEMQVCPYCHADIREDFLVCPSCTARIRGVCRTCRRPIEPGWRICPYCETQVGPAAGSTYAAGGS